MIRAIVQNGLIRPLDPLPAAWVEGHPAIVEDTVRRARRRPGRVVSRATGIGSRHL